MSWPLTVLIIALVVILAITYLFKIGVLGKAKAQIGVSPFIFKLDMKSKERHITEDDFKKTDLKKFYVDSGIGFAIHQPFSSDWVRVGQNIRELWEDKGFSKKGIQSLDDTFLVTDPANNTFVTCFRRGSKQSIKYAADTIMNDRPIDPEGVEQAEEIFEGGEELVYDQIAILALRKDACKIKLGLLELFAREMDIVGHLGPKRLSVNPENTVFLMDCSATFRNIEYNGQRGVHVTNNTILLQENSDYFFEVIVTYIQAGDKPASVWNELTNYLSSFRVLDK